MSGIVERLHSDLKIALKARDEMRVGVLRMLLSRVKDLQIDRGRGATLSEGEITQVLATYAKQRQESAEAFGKGGRTELRDRELGERDIVLAYLPQQLDDEGVRAVLREIIAACGAASARDLGKVMGPAMARLQGRADGGRVQRLARQLLGGG